MSGQYLRVDLAAIDRYVTTILELFTSKASGDDFKKRARDESLQVLLGFDENTGSAKWLKDAIILARKNLEVIEEALASAGYHVARFTFVLKSQGLVGMGSGTFNAVFEVGLTIDPVLGLPYYPGSTVKGAVRAYTESILGEEAASLLFGWAPRGREDPGHVGLAFFSDMYPVGCQSRMCGIYRGLVVNPHYFYHGEPVEDELQAYPEPVQHVGIEEGTIFSIVIGVRGGRDLAEIKSRLKDKINDIVKRGKVHQKSLAVRLVKILDSSSDPGYALLAITSLLLVQTFESGIAARSGKGYNVFGLADESVLKQEFKLQGYRFRTVSHGGQHASRKSTRRQGGRW